MGHDDRNSLVFTVKDKCRVCYTCVRECPVKAIKIVNGQAEVISERCIVCGNCVNVCSQKAKVFLDTKERVKELLSKSEKIAACVAPSFAAEFDEPAERENFVGILKDLGFHKVVEVAFGADLVAREYKKLLEHNGSKSFISSDCPAIVYYIEHYHPNLTENLAPIVSPMTATARVIRKKYGADYKVVFIGPCIAKKAESNELDEAITFKELRELIEEAKLNPINRACLSLNDSDNKSSFSRLAKIEDEEFTNVNEESSIKHNEEKGLLNRNQPGLNLDFDPPRAGKGSIFPVTRGLLQNVNKTDDITEGNILVASGRVNFKEAVKEFEDGSIEATHLELLCCQGCIMGPGMTTKSKRYHRRNSISKYVQEKLERMDAEQWEKDMEEFSGIDLSRTFEPRDRRTAMPKEEELKEVLATIGKTKPEHELNCGACGYDTCREHAIAIIQGFAEDEMCLPYTIEKLHDSVDNLNLSNEKLENAQLALKQSEKLANMGQLSAGIAHELNNPLGVITMYSNLLKDETTPNNPMFKDLELIVEQTDRCKKIVGGLLNFARKNQVKKDEVNIVQFVNRSLQSIVLPDNVRVKTNYQIDNTTVMLDKDQMMQVLTNLEKNAVEAMPKGGTVIASISGVEQEVTITIEDTGVGIPKENMEKLFTPFFTTKKAGKGTGLGLPLVYGIVKMHKGKINVESNTNPEKGQTGTKFILKLPRY